MNPKPRVSPLDKEAPVLLPGLEYARSLIDIAIHVCRRRADRLPDGAASKSPSRQQSN